MNYTSTKQRIKKIWLTMVNHGIGNLVIFPYKNDYTTSISWKEFIPLNMPNGHEKQSDYDYLNSFLDKFEERLKEVLKCNRAQLRSY